MNEQLISLLKQARKDKKLTQLDVALKLGVKDNTLSNWEHGKTEPGIDTFIKLCEIYEVDSALLLEAAYNLKKQGKDLPLRRFEIDAMKKYRSLDESGKETVRLVFNAQYKRCNPLCRDTQISQEPG